VSWIVMERRGSVGTSAVEAFMVRYGEDSRPVQPLNGRRITLG
jgi:carbonic anhydrase